MRSTSSRSGSRPASSSGTTRASSAPSAPGGTCRTSPAVRGWRKPGTFSGDYAQRRVPAREGRGKGWAVIWTEQGGIFATHRVCARALARGRDGVAKPNKQDHGRIWRLCQTLARAEMARGLPIHRLRVELALASKELVVHAAGLRSRHRAFVDLVQDHIVDLAEPLRTKNKEKTGDRHNTD